MHENREISWTSWLVQQDRSAKAINQNADVNVQEKSDCAVVPLNRTNKEGQPSAEVGEGRAQTGENIVQSHMPSTQSGKSMSRIARCAASSNGKETGTVHRFAPPSKRHPTSGKLLRSQAASFARRRWRDMAGV